MTRANAAAGVAGHAGSQASDRSPVPGEVGAANWTRPRNTSRPSIGWCSGECPGPLSGDVSQVYVANKEILLLFQVLACDSRYC